VTAEAAAALLGTSTTILALWEKRFGYPVPEPNDHGERLYADEAMIALRDALDCQLSISAAICHVRRIPLGSGA
jgi:DNA-binding transcriptional MerR regulator